MAGNVYFDESAINNILEQNAYRSSLGRGFGGDWIQYNIIREAIQPTTAAGTVSTGRNLNPYNNPLPNLCFNGGLEIENPDYRGVPMGWIKTGTTAATEGTTWQFLANDPPDGHDRYMRATAPAGGNGPGIYQDIQVRPGRLYTVGAWVRSSASQKAYIIIGTPTDTDRYTNTSNTAATTDTWEYASTTFLVPQKGTPGAEYPVNVADADVLRITCYNAGAEAVTADFTGITLNLGGQAGDYHEHADIGHRAIEALFIDGEALAFENETLTIDLRSEIYG